MSRGSVETPPSSFDARRPPRPPGMGRGALFALLIHAGLIIAIAFGVNWRSSEPAGTSAELWAAVPQVAAPAPPPEPPPPPLPQPMARVEVKPAPAPAQRSPEAREADIAIEKARIEEKERREREEREKAERERLEKERLAKLEREKAEREKAEREKQARLEKEKAEKAEKERLERERREAERREKAQAEQLAKLREEQLRRITGQAGATGGPQATGTAQRDAGPSANYAGKIIARVRPNIVLTETVPATLRAEVEVRAAPDGAIISRRLIRSSGNSVWDEAVLRAIDRTGDLPKDDNGRVPSSIVIGFKPE
jgi:colicin import membrane protein